MLAVIEFIWFAIPTCMVVVAGLFLQRMGKRALQFSTREMLVLPLVFSPSLYFFSKAMDSNNSDAVKLLAFLVYHQFAGALAGWTIAVRKEHLGRWSPSLWILAGAWGAPILWAIATFFALSMS